MRLFHACATEDSTMRDRWLPTTGFILATAIVITVGPGTSAIAGTFTPRMQYMATNRNEPVNYRLVELPTLGGTQDFANSINDSEWVAGAADLAGGQSEHAFVWRDGRMLDLGTLGGTNSVALSVNDSGEVDGDSVTSIADPLTENFCNFTIDGVLEFTDRTCRGFVWLQGVKTQLPTLGGNNDSVFGLNDRGQVVGTAEDARVDPNCVPPQVLDFDAVVWGDGKIRKLRPFPGDTIGVALAINDRGQVVGGSGLCQPISPAGAAHALLWQDDSVTYLGGFGGTMFNAAFDINNRGQVVGLSDLPGDTTTHAFLWQKGVMTDLGTLPGDFASFAFGINDRGQIVGQSCDVNFNCRGFVWQSGVMTDLNALVPPGSLYLTLGESINARGEIAGIAFDQKTGGVPAYVAIPTDRRGAHPAPKQMLPASVRNRFQREWRPSPR
jgi:probable HAF family extracellular repeat protein